MAPPVDRVIHGATVVPSPGDGRILQPGFVAVRGSEIAAVGPSDEAGEWIAGAGEVTEAPWALVLPGLVNAHSHLAAPIFRGLLDEGVRGRGLYDIAFPMEQRLTADDIYWLGLLGCIEVLKAGCTTVNDIYYFAERLADAVELVGIRAVLAEKMFDADLPRVGGGDYSRDAERRNRKLAANVALAERRAGTANGRISVRMGTHATDTCSETFLREAGAEAGRLGIGLHIHTAQSPMEVEHIRETHGCTPVEYLEKLGLLGPTTLAVHCSLNTDGDIDRMARAGCAYAFCPTIYARRGRFPRLLAFLQRGVTTGFGTDWIRMDPWEGMRNASMAMRLASADPEALPAAQALDLQTMGSARALGMAEQIGSLQPGKKADLIMVNLQRAHVQPYYGTLAGLFYTAYPSDVDTVMVDGRTVVEGGRITTVDEATVLDEVQRRLPTYATWLRALQGDTLESER
jgi:5-methylthioadenosine/S-adenosylhomocysteine deaminase